jgi:hypothetical protein
MLRILKTINHILDIKKKNEPQDYIRGFSDCYELLKIGFEKSDQVNLGVENFKLKRILYEFLHYEFEIMASQFQKIKDLYYIYNEDFIVIDKIFNQIVAKPQMNLNQSDAAEFETKLQNFLLKEILYKIINHKFNLTKLQTEHLVKISKSYVSNKDKINTIIKYLTNLEIENEWPDYEEMERKYIELLEEVKILKQIQVEKNELQKKLEILEKTAKEKTILEKENIHLHTIVDLFLHRSVNNFHKYELSEILSKDFKPDQSNLLAIEYLKKLKTNPCQFFKLSEADKLEIRKILNSNQNKEEGIQELFNYINFIVERDEKSINQWIRKKAKRMK